MLRRGCILAVGLGLALGLAPGLAPGLGISGGSARAADAGGDLPAEAPAPSGPGSAIKTSGLKVPRFVILRAGEVNARTGPATRYPIEWVFQRRGMPVEVVAEFDTWRRIRDWQGGEGWVQQGLLSGKRGVIVQGEIRTLRRDPSVTATPVARAEPGVMGSLSRCQNEWCYVDLTGYRGWIKRSEVWGVYPDEKVE